MSMLDQQLAAERAEHQKLLNAPNDKKTHELFLVVHNHFAGCKTAKYGLGLTPEFDSPYFRAARVLLRIRSFSASVPDWLTPGTGMTEKDHNDLCIAWFFNGQYHLECKTAHGVTFQRVFDKDEEVISAMDSRISDL
jgi:hypothetical protein